MRLDLRWNKFSNGSMRNLSLLCCACLLTFAICAASAFAAREPFWNFSGNYRFEGDIRLVAAIQKEVVSTHNREGRKKLAEFRAQDFECVYKLRQQWLCRKFRHDVNIPAKVRKFILLKYLDQIDVKIGEQRADPILLYKGNFYSEWQVLQDIQVGEKTWDRYNYFETDELEKLKIGDFQKAGHFSFVVKSLNSLEYQVSKWNKEDRIFYYMALEMVREADSFK